MITKNINQIVKDAWDIVYFSNLLHISISLPSISFSFLHKVFKQSILWVYEMFGGK